VVGRKAGEVSGHFCRRGMFWSGGKFQGKDWSSLACDKGVWQNLAAWALGGSSCGTELVLCICVKWPLLPGATDHGRHLQEWTGVRPESADGALGDSTASPGLRRVALCHFPALGRAGFPEIKRARRTHPAPRTRPGRARPRVLLSSLP
jgi:hypothetical protein